MNNYIFFKNESLNDRDVVLSMNAKIEHLSNEEIIRKIRTISKVILTITKKVVISVTHNKERGPRV